MIAKLNRRLRIQIVVLTAVATMAASLIPSMVRSTDRPIRSLKDIGKSLEEELGDQNDLASLTASNTLKILLATDSELLWSDLLFDDDARTRTVGLLCIRQRKPAAAPAFAARAVIASARGEAFSTLAEEILGAAQTGQQAAEIAEILERSAPNWRDLADLVTYLGEDNSVAVFEKVELSKCTGQTVAALVSVISLRDPHKMKPLVKDKLDRSIQMLRSLPGYPRCVYLRLVELPPEQFVPMLDSLLDDLSVDNSGLVLMLKKRGDDYVDHLEQRLPTLTEARKKLVQQYIDRATKNK